jgi:ketosteroid isomerase-like protein
MHFAKVRRQKHAQAGPGIRGRRASTEWTLLLALATALLGCLSLLASGSAAQKQNQKDKKQDSDANAIVSPIPPPDGQAIDNVVSQMLGAWQVGDVELMHKTYADDVTVVSGAWEPPLMGWANYARAYQAQRARTQGDRLERSNSYTKVAGNMAWCTYQWRYTGQVDGVPATAFGHTTLVLEKRAGTWLIVLNHTSVVPVSTQGPTPAVAPQNQQPAGQRTSGPGA